MIVLGDFNAKVGASLAPVVGAFGLDSTRNGNGERRIQFAEVNKLVCSDTWFRRNDVHKVTWVSPGGKHWAMLDHILVSRKWRTAVEGVRSRRGADIDSDHYLVCATVRIHSSAPPAADSLPASRTGTAGGIPAERQARAVAESAPGEAPSGPAEPDLRAQPSDCRQQRREAETCGR